MFSEIWASLETELLELYGRYRKDPSAVPRMLKADGTITTEADFAIQACIVAGIRRYDRTAAILAEEDGPKPIAMGNSRRLWVIDPVDGTSQFIQPEGTEFCSAIAVVEDGHPVACMVLAPELREDRRPVLMTVDETGRANVDGWPARVAAGGDTVSATRRTAAAPRRIERAALSRGYRLKTRPTSQILDIIRTRTDLGISDLPPLAWCVCTSPFPWDVMAGAIFATAIGATAALGPDRPLFPLRGGNRSLGHYQLPDLLVASPEHVPWILAHLEPRSTESWRT